MWNRFPWTISVQYGFLCVWWLFSGKKMGRNFEFIRILFRRKDISFLKILLLCEKIRPEKEMFRHVLVKGSWKHIPRGKFFFLIFFVIFFLGNKWERKCGRCHVPTPLRARDTRARDEPGKYSHLLPPPSTRMIPWLVSVFLPWWVPNPITPSNSTFWGVRKSHL